MEIVSFYKGYTIHYYSITGDTLVMYSSIKVKTFKRLGELEGNKMAKEYIANYS